MRSMQASAILPLGPSGDTLSLLGNRVPTANVTNAYAQHLVNWPNASSAAHPFPQPPPFGEFPPASVHENVVEHGPFPTPTVFLRPGAYALKSCSGFQPGNISNWFAETSYEETSLAISILPKVLPATGPLAGKEASIVDLLHVNSIFDQLENKDTNSPDLQCMSLGTIRQVKITGTGDISGLGSNSKQQMQLSIHAGRMAQFGVSVQFEGYSKNKNYFVRTNSDDRIKPGNSVYLVRVQYTHFVDGKDLFHDRIIPMVDNGMPFTSTGQKRKQETNTNDQMLHDAMPTLLTAVAQKREEVEFDLPAQAKSVTFGLQMWHIGFVYQPEKQKGKPDPYKNFLLFKAWMIPSTEDKTLSEPKQEHALDIYIKAPRKVQLRQ